MPGDLRDDAGQLKQGWRGSLNEWVELASSFKPAVGSPRRVSAARLEVIISPLSWFIACVRADGAAANNAQFADRRDPSVTGLGCR